MPILRNRISTTRAGGPRQFAELRDRVMMRVEDFDSIEDVRLQVQELGMETERLSNIPVVIAEPRNRFSEVLERIRAEGNDTPRMREAINDVRDVEDRDVNILEASVATVSATTEFLNRMRMVNRVNIAEFIRTEADFGPENLRLSPDDMPDVQVSDARNKEGNLQSLLEDLGVTEAWNETRGENAIVAIFDTGFAEDLIDSNRIVDTFHGGGTGSVFASSEGHGTMCAGGSAANSEEGVPYDGVAPDAGVILVRITDENGQIRGDIIAEAWDWMGDLDLDRPIVANHSYGTPLCTGRPRTKFCNTVQNDVIQTITSDSDITAVYAAGNEAMTCGHRPSGITNAITGTNSLSEVVAVGALLTDGREAQRYSSHGRGDCSPIADPKPNVSSAIPMNTYYGGEDGWKIKDMSVGVFGSSGGTSHAAPIVTGMIALIQSKAVDVRGEALQTEEVKQIIENNSTPPHRNQINSFGLLLGSKGYDARFGHGQLNINDALAEVQ